MRPLRISGIRHDATRHLHPRTSLNSYRPLRSREYDVIVGRNVTNRDDAMIAAATYRAFGRLMTSCGLKGLAGRGMTL